MFSSLVNIILCFRLLLISHDNNKPRKELLIRTCCRAFDMYNIDKGKLL